MEKHKADDYNRGLIRSSKYAALEPYLIAQAKHETANFTSRVYQIDNNLFGMKKALKRPQNATKGLASPDPEPYKHYARFKSDSDSLLDMLAWLDYNSFPTNVLSPEEYSLQMKRRGFYGDSVENYTKGLKRWL